MRVIGVLDLKGGRAVHARRGDRDAYLPVAEIGPTRVDGDALRLAQAYVEQCGLDELYAADLDAITQRQPPTPVVRSIATIAPLWLDAGVTTVEEAVAARATGAAHVIVGLETLPSVDMLAAITDALGTGMVAFSLDLRNGVPLGTILPPQTTPADLARRLLRDGITTIIVLDLARVGSGAGPDVDMIACVKDAAPDATLIAGGGVRGREDLARLADAGCDAALVATALHDGHLTRTDVEHARAHPRISR